MNVVAYADVVLEPFLQEGRYQGELAEAWNELRDQDFPLDSVCGVLCQRVIDRTADLLSVMRAYPAGHDSVVHAAIEECLVICNG